MKRIPFILFLLFFFSHQFLIAQDSSNVRIDWFQDTDVEYRTAFTIGGGKAIIIFNRGKKPTGLQPYLYSFDKQSGEIKGRLVPGWKHQETSKEFLSSSKDYISDGEEIYRINEHVDDKVRDSQVYTITVELIDQNTLRPIKAPLILIEGKSRSVLNRTDTYISANYIAIVKGLNLNGYPFNTRESAIDVFVFRRDNYELEYKQNYLLNKEGQSLHLRNIHLTDDGKFQFQKMLIDRIKDKRGNIISKEVTSYCTKMSKEGVEEEIEEESSQSYNYLHFTDISEPHTKVKIKERKGGSGFFSSSLEFISIHDRDGRLDDYSVEIPYKDLLSLEKSSYTAKFLKKLNKNKTAGTSLRATGFRRFTDNDGSAYVFYSVQVYVRSGVIPKIMYTSFAAKLSSKGEILWTNCIPTTGGDINNFGIDFEMLVDNQQYVHILTNEVSDEYPGGIYTGNYIREINPEYFPVEILLDKETGEIVSNQVRHDGFSHNEGFAPFKIKLDDNVFLVSKNQNGKLTNMDTGYKLGVTFGIMYCH